MFIWPKIVVNANISPLSWICQNFPWRGPKWAKCPTVPLGVWVGPDCHMDPPVRPNSSSAEFRASVMLNCSCILCYDWTGRRIFPLSQVVWSFNCLVEPPTGLEEKSLKNGISHHWISESRTHTAKPNQASKTGAPKTPFYTKAV